MSKKYLIGASVLLILVAAFIFLNRDGGTPPNLPPVMPSLNSNPAVVTTEPAGVVPVPAQTFEISYDSNGFSPKDITIPKNSTVTFKNLSSSNFWPASGIHPAHTAYPTTGGCIGSTFDACKPIPPGDSWSFKFEIPGAWNYHDHLNAAISGKITVQ